MDSVKLKLCNRGFLLIILLTLTVLLYEYTELNKYPNYSKFDVIRNYIRGFQMFQENVTQTYIVKNPFCSIPNISPYHKSIEKFIKKKGPLICSKNGPLTTAVYSLITNRHTLRVNSQAIHYYSTTMDLLSCCYSIIIRPYFEKKQNDKDDDRYKMSKEVCFKNEIELPPKTEYIFVNCKSKNKSIYKTVQFLVVDKNPKKVPTDGQIEKNYSIFLFAIDSVSKLNFMRTLPNTREYIEKRGWLPLEGYTKVGHNTFPNIMALLTGMKIDQLPASCQQSHKKPFDNCSQLMWKNFSQNGYLTSYSEDWPNLGTFNFQQYGFLNTPTDYYARPILLAAIKHLKKNKIGGFQYCVGGQPQMEYLYQFHTEFFQRFHNRLHFTILWANSFSHEDMNMPAVMDDRIRTFFADIEPYLNTTVVVFFSDHGRRFGEIRQTFVGWLEDQMPFIYFHLPPSLQAAHPSWVDNLRANKNKLTSTFDLHLTLQDLLYGHQLYPAAGCPHCASLFSPIPENRSCADAGIPTNYCPCSAEISMESGTNLNIIAAADNAIRKINNILQEDVSLLEIGYKCANLSLSKVTSIRTQMVPNRAKIPESVNIIAFEVKPSMALFEVTVPEGTVEVRGLEEISRINIYGNQSACVKSNLLKPFCFCEKK